jgi:general secretion pathway protein A
MPYTQRFELREDPFTLHPDPRFFYLTDQHQRAVKKSQFVAENRLGLGVIYGSPGTGKTTLARILYQQFYDSGRYAVVLMPDPVFKTDNRFLRGIIEAFNVGETQKAMADSLRIFENFLRQNYEKSHVTAILMLDHAERINPESYALLDDLLELKAKDGTPLLQVLLFGRHETRDKIVDPRSKRLGEKVAITSSLEPMTFEEMADHVRFRFRVAGQESVPFSEDALKQLYVVSRGNPRAAVKLADAAMEAADSAGQDAVDVRVMRQVADGVSNAMEKLALQENEKPSSGKRGKRGRPPKARK